MNISVPKLPSLLCMKGTKFYSLFTYKNGWDAQKQRPYRISGSTRCVARIAGGDKCGEVIWNEEFLKQFPQLEHFKTIRNQKGKLEFSELDNDDIKISLKDALSAKRYAAGATWVFDALIADTPLAKALKNTFPMYHTHKKILSLAYFLNISDSNAAARYEAFADSHRLPWQHPLTAGAITRLFQSIDDKKIDTFVSLLNEYSMNREQNNSQTKYWALDSTSISTYSQKLVKAEYGHNKDGDRTPQFNVLMVVNQSTGEPVYYRTYSGNVPDVSTIKHYLQEHARIRLDDNAIIVADKGYSSIANIHRFYQSKTSFLLNMRTSFTFCKNLFKSARVKLLDPINYEPSIHNHVYTEEVNWSFPVNFKTDCKRTPHQREKMFVHIYYDKSIYNSHEQTIHENIAKVAKLLRENREIPPALAYIQQTFITQIKDENGNVIEYQTNRQALDDYLLMKGVRILVSDQEKDAVSAYQAYFERNEVEYAFNLFKQRLSGSRFRVSSNQSLEGKAFVQFIATSIAIMLRRRLKLAMEKNSKLKLPYDSERVVIDKLDSIIQTKFELGSYFSEVTGGLKELLEAMQIPVPSESPDNQDIDEDELADSVDEKEKEIESIEDLTDYRRLN